MEQEEIYKLIEQLGQDKHIKISTQALAMLTMLPDDKVKDCIQWYYEHQLIISGSTILNYAGYLDSICKQKYKR